MRTRSALRLRFVRSDVEQAAEQRGAHDIEVARDRIQNLDRRLRRRRAALRSVADEAERDDFLIVAVDQALTQQCESGRCASGAGSICCAMAARRAGMRS